MFFYMNVRRQAPVIMPNVVKRVQPQPQRKVVAMPVESMVSPVLIHESNESGEICDNTKINTIVYNIGDEDVEECFPLPVLEEKVEEIVKTKVEDNKKKNKKKNTRK